MEYPSATEKVLYLGNPNPYKLDSVEAYRFVHNFGEFLVRLDERQKIQPGLAKSWDINRQEQTIKFNLRDEIYSAEDVAESLKRLISQGQTSHSNFSKQILPNTLNVIDNRTLLVKTIGDPGLLLKPLTMADAVILPDDVWAKGKEALVVDWSRVKGPFLWEKGKFPLEKGNDIVLKPNSNHYLYSKYLPSWTIQKVDFSEISNKTNLKNVLGQNKNTILTLAKVETNRLFSEDLSELNYVDTRPNGVHFLLLNQHSERMKQKAVRLALLQKSYEIEVELSSGSVRADQIPQPGLPGRLSKGEWESLKKELNRQTYSEVNEPIIWRVADAPLYRKEWVVEIIKSLGFPYEIVWDRPSISDKFWLNGEVDVQLMGLGMSDSDPISAASYMFSPKGYGADLPDGKILNILNGAKNSNSEEQIIEAVKKAFSEALLEAVVVPLYYFHNRHFFSENIDLGIKDGFSESINFHRIKVRSSD